MVTYTEPRRNPGGQWLCNVVAKCNGVATLQSTYPCDGCEAVAAAHREQIDKLTAERAHHERALELVRQELRRRADADEHTALTAVEELAVRLGMDKVQQLGADLTRLTAAHAAVVDEHTHPVFACKKHESRLPKA